MTQPLETLKNSLQNALTEAQANCESNLDWLTAVSDGLYSCNLSVAALEGWLGTWKTAPLVELESDEMFYLEGVKFVGQIWDEINVVEEVIVC